MPAGVSRSGDVDAFVYVTGIAVVAWKFGLRSEYKDAMLTLLVTQSFKKSLTNPLANSFLPRSRHETYSMMFLSLILRGAEYKHGYHDPGLHGGDSGDEPTEQSRDSQLARISSGLLSRCRRSGFNVTSVANIAICGS